MTCIMLVFHLFCVPPDETQIAPRDAQVYVRSADEIEAERKRMEQMKMEGKG